MQNSCIPPILNINNPISYELTGLIRPSQLHKPSSAHNEVSMIPLTVISHHNLHPLILAQLRVAALHLVTPAAPRSVTVEPGNGADVAPVEVPAELAVPAGARGGARALGAAVEGGAGASVGRLGGGGGGEGEEGE